MLYWSINLDFEFFKLKTATVDENDQVDFETELSLDIAVSYINIENEQDILRCSINQASLIFKQNAGKQCTAMATSFLCSFPCWSY